MARQMAMPGSQIVRPAVAELKPKAKLGLDQLRACMDESGREAPDSPANIPVGARGVTLDEWRERLRKTEVINVEGNPRQQFKRILEDLQSAKVIDVWEGFVWLAWRGVT